MTVSHLSRQYAGNFTRLACILLATTCTANAAEVTFERLRNPEPQNWLMNHHDFGSQRFSSLDTINKSNVKTLKLAFAVALDLVPDPVAFAVRASGPRRWCRARR